MKGSVIIHRESLILVTEESNKRKKKERLENFVTKNTVALEKINNTLLHCAHNGISKVKLYANNYNMLYEELVILAELLKERGYNTTVGHLLGDNNDVIEYYIVVDWS